jgi:hypothetical protein
VKVAIIVAKGVDVASANQQANPLSITQNFSGCAFMRGAFANTHL